MRIGIIGEPDDLTAVYFSWVATNNGHEILPLLESSLGVDWWYHMDEVTRQASIVISEKRTELAAWDGFFVRLSPVPAVPQQYELEGEEADFFITERRSSIQYFLNHTSVPTVNRPLAGRSNASKPYQMSRLAGHGFVIPEWLVTNDPNTVADFQRSSRNGCIYKSCSGLRSRVRMVDDPLLDRLKEGSSPIIVQHYIPGRDVRIHTVGNSGFPTESRGIGVDSRFDPDKQEYAETTAPGSILDKCCLAAADEGLVLAGFDFRVTADDAWYCLEMNPVPTFMPYEFTTRQPIAQAILEYFEQTSRH